MGPAALVPPAIESLDREGYVVVPDALDAGWLARLRLAFADAPAQKDGTQHVAIREETPEREAWTRLEAHPVILAAAWHILDGAPFRVGELHGRNPLPGYGLQGLHADWMPRATVKPFVVVTAIWMLDDFTPENGATRVVPGTHRLTRAIDRRTAQPTAHHRDERLVTGRAGSVLVFNGHLWHSGTRNESRGPRRAVQHVLRPTSEPPGRPSP